MAVALPLPPTSPAGERGADSGGLAAGWALVVEAGEAIASLAQLAPEARAIAPREFAMRAAAAGPARVALAEDLVDDCAAALHVGLTALLAATQSGRDPTAAALTLWREQDRARSALLALVASAY